MMRTYRFRRKGVSQKRVRELFDYANGSLIWKVRSARRVRIGDIAGFQRKRGDHVVSVDGVQYLLHRLIYLWHTGDWPDYIDHIDRDPSNNTIENLRPISNGLNMFNSSKTTSNTGYRGVHRRSNGCFVAKINNHYKQITIGHYKSAEEASAAYERMREELYSGIYLT